MPEPNTLEDVLWAWDNDTHNIYYHDVAVMSIVKVKQPCSLGELKITLENDEEWYVYAHQLEIRAIDIEHRYAKPTDLKGHL